MKIDPVYLVAAKTAPATMPSRRAFLFAGCTFTLGTVVGGACGYSLGAAATPTKAPEEDLKPSEDVELDELRRLAIKAPIEELVDKRRVFLGTMSLTYRDDDVLWKGVDRLIERLLADQGFPERRIFAKFLAQTIQFAAPERRSRYQQEERDLRAIR